MKQKIVFNGQEYNSVEEMPAEIRPLYEQMMGMFADKNQDGIPDMFQQSNIDQVEQMPVNVSTTQMIVVDGKVYQNIADLLPEVRSRYEAKMAQVDKNQDGVPDVLEGFWQGHVTTETTPAAWQTAVSPPLPQPDTPHVVTTDSASLNILLVGAVIFILLLIIAALVVYILFI